MEFPYELRCEIERLLESENPRQLSAAAEGISSRYRSESGTGKSLVSGRRDVLAYAAVRMPATFGAVSKALELVLAHFGGGIDSILDIGAGTGAASFAAHLLTDCAEITCVEREPIMSDIGIRLSAAMGLPIKWENRDITKGIQLGADLVLSSYCLNELSAAARTEAVKRLWASAGKLLLIVDTGTPVGYSQMLEARDILKNEGAHIIAPCPHEGACPLDEGDWCHFTVRIARSKLHKQLKGGDAPYEDEKFCFIAAAREDYGRCGARILRHPRIESGRITLKLCTAGGICERMVTKKDPRFKAARKSDCGDEF
ncbi:MAG: small ribosomal subunit Rsm22 family protein [Oscillospiraceae bacterium]